MVVDAEGPKFLNVRETANLLGIHENTVRNWVREGKLQSSRLPGTKFHRFDERDVQRLLKQRGRRAPQIGAERLAIRPELATGSDLAFWPVRASREAQDAFPELIRRLLAATPGVTDISARASDGISLSGWDGNAHAHMASFLPDGELCFEFGTNKRIREKADEDWANRKSTDGAKDQVFIFATPRRWRDGKKWAQARREEKLFRDVRVLDADDLEGWLQETPTVHYWVSERLGHRPRDVETLAQWWTRFREQTDPELPGALFLAGRDAARADLTRFVQGPADALVIQSAWHQDSLAFSAAVLDAVDEDQARTTTPLLVKSAEAWDPLISTRSPMVVIPIFDDPQVEPAVRRGHHVIVPVGSNQTVRGARIKLSPPHRELARQSLEAAGLPFDRAYELSGRARRNMPSMVRELARDQRLRDPKWAESGPARLLAPLILLGAWSITSPADLELVEELVDAPWRDIERELRTWLRHDDRPFILSGETQWHLASSEEAFLALCQSLTSEDLLRWRKLAPQVLLEADPVLDLKADERHLAGVRGVGRSYSSVLRKGVADGLAIMGSLSSQISGGFSGEEEARQVARSLFAQTASDDTGGTWRSLSDVMPLLAEAAPFVFLDAVEDDLASPQPLLKTMFQDGSQTSWLTSSSPHTGLLWALETLCWSSSYLTRSALALARLERLDPGGKLGNRPQGSLQTIFAGWVRHTSASRSEKVAALKVMCRQVSEVGWELVMNTLPTHYASALPPHSPAHHDWSPSDRGVPVTEWVGYIEDLVGIALEMVDDHAMRWASLAERIARLPPSDQDRVIVALTAFSQTNEISDSDRLDLWERLSAEVAHHQQFEDADWAMAEATRLQLEAVAAAFEPKDDTDRFAYLFDWRPDLPGIDRMDFAAQEERLTELREKAARETIETAGIEGLRALASRAKVSHFLGWATGAVAPEALTPDLAAWLDSEELKLRAVGAYWVRRKTSGSDGLAWLVQLLQSPELESVQRRQTAVINMPPTSEFWDSLQQVDPELADSYWSSFNLPVVGSDDLSRAVEELVSRTRPWAAIDLLAGGLHQVTPGVPAVDREQAERALSLATTVELDETRGQTIGYAVGVVLDFLESVGAPQTELARYEFAFFRLIEHHRAPRALFQELGRNPALYVDLLKLVYRAKDGPDVQLDERQTLVAHQAWWVLAHWSTMPGLGDDGSLDEQQLEGWIETARLLLADADRADVGDERIGEVLSHSPDGVDGIWPAEAVRNVVERFANKELESGLMTGRMNSRSVTTRGVYDGGAQERALANEYAEWSRQTGVDWPRTSRILRLLGESYESHARREDLRAEIDSDVG